MRPFFGYFGGKFRAAPHYPEPLFDTIVEPFAGSAGYALRHNAKRVVLCELDPLIASLWAYLITATQREILALPDIPLDGQVSDLGLAPVQETLIGLWLNAGHCYPCKRPGAWMRSGLYPSNFWGVEVRQSIAFQLPQIRHWEIVGGSYRDLEVPGPATWFIDPPYQVQGTRYRFGSEKIDFGHLSEYCKTREGQVIVCEQVGADWLPFAPFRKTNTTRSGKVSREAIWIGGVA